MRYGPGDTLGALDPKPREIGDKILRPAQHNRVLRPAGSLEKVGAVVGDHEQHTTGHKRRRCVRQYLATLPCGKVQVHDQNKVEGGPWGLPLDDVGLDPLRL